MFSATYCSTFCLMAHVCIRFLKFSSFFQDYTNRMFEKFLLSADVVKLTQVNAVQKERHRMANGAKCLCLCVEECIDNCNKQTEDRTSWVIQLFKKCCLITFIMYFHISYNRSNTSLLKLFLLLALLNRTCLILLAVI